MVHQAQVGEDAHAHCLQAPLITEREAIAVNLPRGKDKKSANTQTRDTTLSSLLKSVFEKVGNHSHRGNASSLETKGSLLSV